MATSKSASRGGKWTAGASVYSGRSDPAWTVSARVAAQLLKIWQSLKKWKGRMPSPPALGYRGCFLRDTEGREWHAYDGAVTLRVGAVCESRRDPDREFEKTLLASAPPGRLPL